MDHCVDMADPTCHTLRISGCPLFLHSCDCTLTSDGNNMLVTSLEFAGYFCISSKYS